MLFSLGRHKERLCTAKVSGAIEMLPLALSYRIRASEHSGFIKDFRNASLSVWKMSTN